MNVSESLGRHWVLFRRAVAQIPLVLLLCSGGAGLLSCTAETNSSTSDPDLDALRARATDTGLISVQMNPPGTDDILVGAALSVGAQARVSVYQESSLSTLIAEDSAEVDGSFSIAIGDNLATSDEVHVVVRRFLTSPDDAFAVANDVTPPSTPIVGNLILTTNITGIDDTLSGTAGAFEASTDVHVYLESSLTTLIGSSTSAADGSVADFSIGDNQATADLVYVVAVDAVGNKSAAVTQTNDITAPGAPSSTEITVTMSVPGIDDTIVGVAGAVEPLVDVRVYQESGLTTLLGSTTAAADGSFASFSIGDNLATSDLVYVVSVDALGNVSSAVAISNDVTAPSAPDDTKITVNMVAAGADDSVSGVAGAVEGSAVVEVFLESGLTTSLGSTTAAANGSFSISSIGDNQATSDLVYIIATDTAGNVSASTALTNDITAPASLSVVDTTVTMNAPGNADTVQGALGAVEALATVKIYKEAGLTTLLGSIAAASDGSFAAFDIGDNQATADLVYAVVVDAGGNVSASQALSNDVTGPAAPVGGNLTVTMNLVGVDDEVSGTAGAIEALGTLEIYLESGLTTIIGSGVAAGDGSVGAFSIGDNQATADLVYAVAVDTAGNPSATATALSNDVTPPVFSVLPRVAAISETEVLLTWLPATDAVTSDEQISYSVCQAANSGDCAVSFTVDAGPVAERFSQSMASLGAASDVYFVVRATDAAGNSTDSSEASRLIETIVVKLSSGNFHSCARYVGDEIKCWGKGGYIGDGTDEYSATPIQVSASFSGAIDFGVGPNATCAVASDNTVWCWGDGGTFGILGDLASVTSNSPVQVCAVGETVAPCSAPLSGVQNISVSGDLACAVLQTGEVVCWGSNAANGSLGEGSGTDSAVPVYVCVPGVTCTGNLTGMTTVAVGDLHACALGAGDLYCWGRGTDGEIGDGGGVDTPFPVQITGTWISVAAAGKGTCAVASDNTVWCWGLNDWGEIGDGTVLSQTVPTQVCAEGETAPCVTFITDALKVAKSDGATCVLRTGGVVSCWGSDLYGELGEGSSSTLFSSIPLPVTGVSGASLIFGGAHGFCAIGVGAATQCWGDNSSGQLGTGDGSKFNVPVFLGSGFTAVSGGSEHMCTVASGTEQVACTGSNQYKQIADSPDTGSNLPWDITGITAPVIGLGDDFSCELQIDGSGSCWGANSNGQLGIGSFGADVSTPTAINTVTPFLSVSGGAEHACALSDTVPKSAYCWGRNDLGQTGNTTDPVRNLSPLQVMGLPGAVDAVKVLAGSNHGCALFSDQSVYCWGDNADGQVGSGDTSTYLTATQVCAEGQTAPCGGGFLTGAIDIAVGANHSCALITGGGVKCWGLGTDGALGEGAFTSSSAPISVCESGAVAPCGTFLTGVTSISAGARHTCAIVGAGEVYCWGDGAAGQLGAGDFDTQGTPMRIPGLGTASGLFATRDSTCLFLANGDLNCWGSNAHGGFGLGLGGLGRIPNSLLGGY